MNCHWAAYQQQASINDRMQEAKVEVHGPLPCNVALECGVAKQADKKLRWLPICRTAELQDFDIFAERCEGTGLRKSSTDGTAFLSRPVLSFWEGAVAQPKSDSG